MRICPATLRANGYSSGSSFDHAVDTASRRSDRSRAWRRSVQVFSSSVGWRAAHSMAECAKSLLTPNLRRLTNNNNYRLLVLDAALSQRRDSSLPRTLCGLWTHRDPPAPSSLRGHADDAWPSQPGRGLRASQKAYTRHLPRDGLQKHSSLRRKGRAKRSQHASRFPPSRAEQSPTSPHGLLTLQGHHRHRRKGFWRPPGPATVTWRL